MKVDRKSLRRARVTRSIALVSAGALLGLGTVSLGSDGVTGPGILAVCAGVVMLVLALRSGRVHRSRADRGD